MISIVTAYFNRKPLFYNTLKSIDKSSIKDFEVVVVDDCSDEEHRLEDLTEEFNFLRVIRLEKKDKWYVNPCVPFNVGIKEAKGDVIILQNPECFHLGDVMSDVLERLTDTNYLAYGCYSLDKGRTGILGTVHSEDVEKIKEVIAPLPHQIIREEGGLGWYNHSQVRPVAYHFLSAIKKSNMDKLNGFDERYAKGIAYDDDELLVRIRRMGLDVQIVNNPFVLHQWHYDTNNFVTQATNTVELLNHNRNLLNNVTRREQIIKVNT
jgi:glycosyltransferase involved in cell wall biosynthesis